MKTPKAKFELFQSEVVRWIEEFGLYDWDIDIELGSFTADAGDAEINYYAKYAKIKLGDNLSTENLTDTEIKRTAFHEVFHVVLAGLYIRAKDRHWSNMEYEIEEHSIINRIHNVIGE